MAEQIGDDRSDTLPEGTDTVIEGAASTADAGDAGEATLEQTAAPRSTASSSTQGGIADRIRSGREQFASQAGDRARGIVTQGLERTSEALANVSKMVGDTAAGIEERLGPEYGDYARPAAGALENVANTNAQKDPDELVDDTRTFVRSSPGIALAGAAVVGFVVARLIKSGIGPDASDDDEA